MKQRIERWRDGVLLETVEVDVPDPVQQPLDPVGALATLLVVNGTLTAQDAANAVRLTEADLVAEAQAWAVASRKR